MKQQISRFSPHQNGKVVAVLMAVVSLIILIPMPAADLSRSDRAAPPRR